MKATRMPLDSQSIGTWCVTFRITATGNHVPTVSRRHTRTAWESSSSAVMASPPAHVLGRLQMETSETSAYVGIANKPCTGLQHESRK